MRVAAVALGFGLTAAQMASALDLALPATAQQTATRNSALDVFSAPLEPFDPAGTATVRLEGAVDRAAWRVASAGLTPLQVMQPLREDLEAAGYDIVFECGAAACGGYDFRFQLETLPAPSMFVNIRAYHYLTATKGAAESPDDIVSVITSTSAFAAHLQIIHATTDTDAQRLVVAPSDAPVTNPLRAEVASEARNLANDLMQDGRFILDTLDFATGTTQLAEGANAQLEALAALTQARPDLSFVLVGHTDSTGSLDANIDISRRRAAAVRQRLIESYGVEAGRLRAEGMGYLAPIANNLDAAGREANRRVEVIVVGPN